MQPSIAGKSDGFPSDQCTYWASYRYQQLTGDYVPWSGNANQWAGNAATYGWINAAVPPSAPSIICLQGGVQGADASDGHVGVVEKVNSDGSVQTSDLNWGLTQQQLSQVRSITFQPGPGVSFIYAVDSSGAPLSGNGSAPPASQSSPLSIVSGAVAQIPPNADVAAVLVALDTALAITNPFDVTQSTEYTIFGVGIPGTSDPLTYVVDVLANIGYDFEAIIVRLLFIIIGLAVLFSAGQVVQNAALAPIGGQAGALRLATSAASL